MSLETSQVSAIIQSEGQLKICSVFIGWEGQIGTYTMRLLTQSSPKGILSKKIMWLSELYIYIYIMILYNVDSILKLILRFCMNSPNPWHLPVKVPLQVGQVWTLGLQTPQTKWPWPHWWTSVCFLNHLVFRDFKNFYFTDINSIMKKMWTELNFEWSYKLFYVHTIIVNKNQPFLDLVGTFSSQPISW